MTDNEIIKIVECCIGGYGVRNCDDCSMQGKVGCIEILPRFALDLINRQKAQIERLKKELDEYPIKTVVGNNCEIHSKTSEDYDNLIADIYSGAIKDFAEKFSKELSEFDMSSVGLPDYDRGYKDCMTAIEDTIDNLVKEMTEVEK